MDKNTIGPRVTLGSFLLAVDDHSNKKNQWLLKLYLFSLKQSCFISYSSSWMPFIKKFILVYRWTCLEWFWWKDRFWKTPAAHLFPWMIPTFHLPAPQSWCCTPRHIRNKILFYFTPKAAFYVCHNHTKPCFKMLMWKQNVFHVQIFNFYAM